MGTMEPHWNAKIFVGDPRDVVREYTDFAREHHLVVDYAGVPLQSVAVSPDGETVTVLVWYNQESAKKEEENDADQDRKL